MAKTYIVIDGIAYPVSETKEIYQLYLIRRGLYSLVQVRTGMEVCTARGKKLAQRRLEAIRASQTDDIYGLRVLALHIR